MLFGRPHPIAGKMRNASAMCVSTTMSRQAKPTKGKSARLSLVPTKLSVMIVALVGFVTAQFVVLCHLFWSEHCNSRQMIL
jgi:lysylphosphatidylglycerol synthetase-like protein (DUF2156 family)